MYEAHRPGRITDMPSSHTTLSLAMLFLTCSLPTMALATDEPGAHSQGVEIIDPATVSPLLGPPPFDADGAASHRRVVTHDKFGTVHLDMGYNTYKQGVKLSIPYAYKTDEVCFVSSGRIRMQDEGLPFELGPGKLMWRPAGGVTRWAEMLEDTVTICSMAPARLDSNSHRVAPQDVGKWQGDPAARPYPYFYSIDSAPVITSHDKSASRGVIEREVLSKRKQGSAKVSVIYTTLEVGAHVATPSIGEEICWVNTGKLRITSAGKTNEVPAHWFLYRPEGIRIDRIEATETASMTCLFGPAAL